MAETQNEARRDKFSHTFYILLKDICAKKQDRDYSYSSSNLKYLLKGEILVRNLTTVVDSTNGTLRLHPYEKGTYSCDCPVENINPLEDEEAKLLLSFKTNGERYKHFTSSSLDFGKKLTIGSNVYVKVRSLGGGTQEVRGVIRYKGPLPGELGTMFGVELLEGRGRGTTDGLFRTQRYFQCDTECGIFVSLEKLRLYDGTDENMFVKFKNRIVGGITSLIMPGEQPDQENSLGKKTNSAGHQEGDRVWMYVEDKLCAGYIRYIGRVPGGKETYAGIELDHAEGLGDGEYEGKQLFTCHKDRAHFTPIDNVITKEKLDEIMGTGKNATAEGDCSSSNNTCAVRQTSEDIVDMESRFSNQSKDQIIKEQEQLLKDIKRKEEKKNKQEKDNTDHNKYNERTQNDEQWKNENQSKLNNHVSHAAINMNAYVKDTRGPTSPEHPQMANSSLKSDLVIGSMVEVLSKKDKPKYGVIRWLGFVKNSDKKIAGLELDDEMEACTDGTFLGKRYFTCPSRRGFFVHVHNCSPDSRFNKSSMQNAANKRLSGTEFGPYESPIIDGPFIPPPETMDVYLKQKPQGIQGHHNSCYLDATLFAAFAFSSIMDSILFRPKTNEDIEEYDSVQTVLRNKIIYPLRSQGFVRADRVMELRKLLDKLGDVTGLMGEEKDPEEFLLTLLQQVLKSEPFLKIKSGKEVRDEYFYQVLAEKDVERVLPSVEELLKRSFYQSDLKLAEVPSCLIVQMPRFGKGFKMYDRILPSLKINIGELVDNAPQDCAVCGLLALFHCKDCFTITGLEDTDCSGNFCVDCHKRIHSHVKRNNHKYVPIAVPRHIRASYVNKHVEHREMELFAVICIQTSHYVTFAKCEEPGGEVKWCFFDSMADRIGTKDGYNIPSVTECPEVIEWLSSEKQNRERIINTEDKRMPDRVRRLLGDAYVCLYESKEMAMYK